MLVLTRRLEEKIHIGSDITITILRIKGRMVKIGIEAPHGTQVLRGELLDEDRTPGRQNEPSRSHESPIDCLPSTRRSPRRDVAPDAPPSSRAGAALLWMANQYQLAAQ